MSDAVDKGPVPVRIKILDKDYTIGCEPEQRDSLQAAAMALDGRMREIRGANRMAAMDRVIVLAALNFVSELHALQRTNAARESELSSMLESLSVKLDALPTDPAV